MMGDAHRARFQLDDHDHEQAVERGLAEFAKAAPEEALPLAIELLEAQLVSDGHRDRSGGREDYSTMWRPRIAAGGRQRYGRDRANALVDVVRDTAADVARAGADQLRAVGRLLEARSWPVFRRIALHVILETADLGLIREKVLDMDLLYVEHEMPEYDEMIRRRFLDLTEEDRRAYLDLVRLRPAPSVHASGEPVEPERAEAWTAGWRARRLRVVEQALARDIEDQQDETDTELEDGRVREPAAISADTLVEMPIAEVVEHLRTWKAPGTFMGPTVRAQGDALGDAARRDPTTYAGNTPAFRGLDPTYVRSLLRGLRQAVEEDKVAIAWGPVLDLASWVCDQAPFSRDESQERDPGWTWTRREIAELLNAGLVEQAGEIPFESREVVWRLLADVVRDEAQGLVDADERRDSLMAALNSTRGAALTAIIAYIAWVRRHADPSQPAMSLAPEAGDLLERHLDPAHDRSIATRGALGVRIGQLAALDRDWLRAQRGRLFPDAHPQLAELTWQAYVCWNRPTMLVLELLPEAFHEAIERTPTSADEGHVDADAHLVEHVLLFYLWGRIEIHSADGLLLALFAHATPRLRAHAIEFAGRVMRESNLDVEQCARLQALWTWRLEDSAHGDEAGRRAEVVQFGWWFTSPLCDQAWLLAELVRSIEIAGWIEPDSLVLDKLADIAVGHPIEALRCVELLVARPKERWFISATTAELQRILGAALVSDTTHARARALVNRLVADGYIGMKNLLGA